MLRRYSVRKLNKISKNREIWCCGCGKIFNDMLNMRIDQPFINRITCLIDRSELLNGKTKMIAHKCLTIHNYNVLKEIKDRKVIILITSDAYEAIYEQIKEIIDISGVECLIYPEMYSEMYNVLLKFFSYFSIKRSIIFYEGKQPHENADAIWRYLNEKYRGKPYKVYFLTDENNKKEIGKRYILDILKTKKYSIIDVIKYCYRYSVAAYLCYENEPLKKVREEQRLIFLNHGTIPLKKVSDVMRQPKQLDLAVCSSKFYKNIFCEQYGVDESKLIFVAPPRICNIEDKPDKAIEKKLNIQGKQLILWLPTFRKLSGTDRVDGGKKGTIEEFLQGEYLKMVDETLGRNNQVILIKPHPRSMDCFNEIQKNKNIFVINDNTLKKNGYTLYSVMSRADALITDYSSIAFEYMLYDRPIGYYIGDINKYSRGFSVEEPRDFMPGYIMYKGQDIIHYIEMVKKGIDLYKEERDTLVKKMFEMKDRYCGAKVLLEMIDEDWNGKVFKK